MTSPASQRPSSSYTAKQKRDELFRRGVLHWKLHAGQKAMYEAIQASQSRRFVVNAARRLGKSYMLSVMAIQHALAKPGSQVKFGAPNQKMARKIIVPLFRDILQDCPKDLRPKYRIHDSEYEFYNGSTITVCGTEQGQVDGLRGTACDLALMDECGFMSDLPYVIDSIIMPQLLTRPDSRIIMASTPPVSPDHAFVSKYMLAAMQSGAYAKFDIYSNPLLTPETIEEFKRESGGEDTTTWRREYLAEIVAETDNAIFPEATQPEIMDAQIYEVQRPPFFLPIVAIDLGYLDYTGVLFGYYHFPLAKIVIEDEILINKATSAEIVAMVKAKEQQLWGDVVPRTRVVDGPALVIADLNSTHKFHCRTPDKSDLSANVNRVRIDLAARSLAIHPRCAAAIAQIRYAVWDSSRTKFARSATAGHFDLAAALLYFCKHIDRQTNPTPPGYGWDTYNDFGFPRQRTNDALTALKAMFPFTRKN